jgi:predicted esterase YcpF (UPF0227 family)
MIRYTERPNFTKEQIEQHVIDTLEVAALAALTAEDRAVMLPQIFDKLASKQIVAEQYQLGSVLGAAQGRPGI